MPTFTRAKPDVITLSTKILDLLENAEKGDNVDSVSNYNFDGMSFKIRVRLIDYPWYAVIEIINEAEKP